MVWYVVMISCGCDVVHGYDTLVQLKALMVFLLEGVVLGLRRGLKDCWLFSVALSSSTLEDFSHKRLIPSFWSLHMPLVSRPRAW